MTKTHITGGYFIFPRILLEGKLWQNKDAFRLYLYYLSRARYAAEPEELEGWMVRRGELLTSLQQISDDTAWVENKQNKRYSRDRILRLNKLLTNNSLTTVTSNSRGTKITVCNYSELQNFESYTSNTSTTATSNTGTTYNNKVNKYNNKNNSPNSGELGRDSTENVIESSLQLNINNTTGEQSKEEPPVEDNKPNQLPAKDNHSRQKTNSKGTVIHSTKTVRRGKNFNADSDEIRLSKLLFEYIQKRDPGAKVPDFQKWAYHVDKLRLIDNRPFKQIEEIIHWCQRDKFWRKNILSTEKLRKQFSQLIQHMKGEQKHDITKQKHRIFQPNNSGGKIEFDKKYSE